MVADAGVPRRYGETRPFLLNVTGRACCSVAPSSNVYAPGLPTFN